MLKEPTQKEILNAVSELHEAVSIFATNVDERFEKIDERFEKIDQRFEKIDQRFETLESKMVTKDYLEDRLSAFESKMVTKDYLDDKLFDLRGDIAAIIRKEDRKIESLVEILYKKKVLSKEDKKCVLAMEPFPKTA